MKYPNIFSFGNCTNVDTTRSYWAVMNQQVVARNNLWDYLHGTPMKAVYEGYTSWDVIWAMGRSWTFKHTYDYQPTTFNFWVPKFLGYPVYKLKSSLDRQYFTKIYQLKPNYGYPYLSKDRYFRPIEENKFIKERNISIKDVFPHENIKPVLSYEAQGHGEHGHKDGQAAAPAH